MAKRTSVQENVVGLEKLDGLDPLFRVQARQVIEEMQQKGWKLRIVWGKHTKDENDALVEQGVASKKSKHLEGKALDLIDRHTGYTNDRNHKYYKDLQAVARKVRVTWGGDFTSRWDPCHVEAAD